MRKTIILTLFSLFAMMTFAQTKVRLSVGGNSMTATLVDNQATRELVAMLEKSPITITMSDYGGFEKVGTLPRSFTTSNSRITTEPGDIMLYQGNSMVIFYGTNTWSYTRLGKIDGATAANLRAFLGDGTITLTVSLDTSAGVTDITHDDNPDNNTDNNGYNRADNNVYNLNGTIVKTRPLPPGIYIVNGRKTLIRH